MGESTAADARATLPRRIITLSSVDTVAPQRASIADVTPRICHHEAGRYERFIKPVVDRLLGAVLLLVALPVILAIMGAVRLTMGPPTIFRQARVGRHGNVFMVYKFKTMVEDRRRAQRPHDGPERRQRHKTSGDPRVTRLGGMLRKWSLDELPQLWNVVRGEMSLVGPRPELLHILERHYQPWQLQRHQVKPGITGLWQISSREDGLIYENVDLDLDYIENVSFAADVKILLKTAVALLGRSPGY